MGAARKLWRGFERSRKLLRGRQARPATLADFNQLAHCASAVIDVGLKCRIFHDVESLSQNYAGLVLRAERSCKRLRFGQFGMIALCAFGYERDKRQTADQAAAFAKRAVEQNKFQRGSREPYDRIMGWLLSRVGRS